MRTACALLLLVAFAGASVAETIVAESALLRVCEQAAAPARTAGVLSEVGVEEGDLIRAGQLIAQVDDTDAVLLGKQSEVELELAAHRAKNDVAVRSAGKALAFSRGEHTRMSQAYGGLPGSVSRSEFEESRVAAEQAELDVEQAAHDRQTDTLTERLKRAELAVAKRVIESHRIESPLSGVVVEVLRRRGEWVEPGDEVLKVMRLDKLRVEGLIDANQISGDLRGAAARVTVSLGARPPQTVAGRVVFVHPEINPVNNRVRVRAEIANPDLILLPGMRAEMIIDPNDREPPAKPRRVTPVARKEPEAKPASVVSSGDEQTADALADALGTGAETAGATP
ncbi:MAG: efflux RND transporter periplasmic adaptor subunit [Planctomycetota bacterium]